MTAINLWEFCRAQSGNLCISNMNRLFQSFKIQYP